MTRTTQAGMQVSGLRSGELHRYLSSQDVAGYWRRPSRQLVRAAAIFTALYCLLVSFSFATAEQLDNFVVFWPAFGLLAGMLSCTPLRTWPVWIVCSVAGRFIADQLVRDDIAAWYSLTLGAVSGIEGLIFAALMRNPLEQVYKLSRPLYLMLAQSLVALFSAAVGATLGASIYHASGATEPYWATWRAWVLGDCLGLLIVGPLVVWYLLPQFRIPRESRSAAEYAVPTGIAFLTLAIIVASSQGNQSAGLQVPGTLAVLTTIPLIWAAARFIYPVVAIGLFLLAVLVNWATSQGVGPLHFSALETFATHTSVQLYLLFVTLIVMSVAFSVLERERAIAEIALRRRLEGVLVSLSRKMIDVTPGRVDETIDGALREIGNFASADRCLLYQMSPDRHTFEETHAWYGPEAGDSRKIVGVEDVARFPWALKTLQEEGYFAFDNMPDEVPEEFAPLQQAVPRSSSILYIGLFTDGVLYGCIGFDWLRARMDWTHETRAMLYLVGQLFSNMLTRMHVEQALEDYQAKLRSMAREISRSEERARRRAAVDVHDGVGQNLAVARMTISSLLASGKHDASALTLARELIDTALHSTRHVIADLSPAVLYELGLVPAIRSLAERFVPASDLQCEVNESGGAWNQDDDLKVDLYRVVRELLTNVAKHANAESADVCVTWQPDAVRITVEDDGIGFETGEGGPAGTGFLGYGLFSVREQVEFLGGRFDIRSSRGIGTRVQVDVPRTRPGTAG